MIFLQKETICIFVLILKYLSYNLFRDINCVTGYGVGIPYRNKIGNPIYSFEYFPLLIYLRVVCTLFKFPVMYANSIPNVFVYSLRVFTFNSRQDFLYGI